MVYCGKPSKGCQRCRERRNKCDLVKPKCTQCIRAKVECTGYRDVLELRFRSENDDVSKRFHAREAAKARKASENTIAVKKRSQVPVIKFQAQIALPRHIGGARLDPFVKYPSDLHPNTEFSLVDHYLCHIAPPEFKQDEHANFQPIRFLCFSVAVQDPAAFHVILAAAAADADAHRGLRDSEETIWHRVTAIRMINERLGDPSAVTSDGTIATIAIVAGLELLIGSQENFNTHMNGLSRLIEMRGGFQNVQSSNPQLALMIQWFDYAAACHLVSSRRFPPPNTVPSTSSSQPLCDSPESTSSADSPPSFTSSPPSVASSPPLSSHEPSFASFSSFSSVPALASLPPALSSPTISPLAIAAPAGSWFTQLPSRYDLYADMMALLMAVEDLTAVMMSYPSTSYYPVEFSPLAQRLTSELFDLQGLPQSGTIIGRRRSIQVCLRVAACVYVAAVSSSSPSCLGVTATDTDTVGDYWMAKSALILARVDEWLEPHQEWRETLSELLWVLLQGGRLEDGEYAGAMLRLVGMAVGMDAQGWADTRKGLWGFFEREDVCAGGLRELWHYRVEGLG